jgi:hypothetical protein
METAEYVVSNAAAAAAKEAAFIGFEIGVSLRVQTHGGVR